tara:strand:+ start:482 stop:754 length:273 start_codon:yes stop_codon:yes gene_type:complete
MSTKKLEKLDLESIQKLQEKFSQCTTTLGLLEIDKRSLNNQLILVEEETKKQFLELESVRETEQELLKNLQEKYGEGQINIQDGTFTSNN